MTDRTTDAVKDQAAAREWAEYITSVRELHGDYAPQARAAARFILDNTTPTLPDPLFGARATHPEYGEGIVTSHFPGGGGNVRFMFSNDAIGDGTSYWWVEPSSLTFHTPETPDHPEYLETEQDYANAPEGTIVAGNDAVPKVLLDGMWRHIYLGSADHEGMAGARRRVLRWGWEA